MPRLLALRLYYLAMFASLGAYIPYFPRWIEARGMSGVAMGALVATIPAMGIVGPPIFGLVADALGLRGWVLRVASMGTFLALGLVAAPLAAGGRPVFAALLAATVVYAFFRSPMIMMADVIAMEEVRAAGTTYGRVRLWGSIGFLASSLIVGRLVDPRAPIALPIAIAAPLLAAVVATFALPARAAAPPSLAAIAAGRAKELLSGGAYPLFLAAAYLAQLAHSSYDLCFSLHLRDLGASGQVVGAAWATGVVFEVALMAGSAPILARFGAPRLLAVGLLAASARWAIIASVRSVPILVALQPLHALSFGLVWITSLAYIRGAAPPRALATAQGLFSAACGAGSVSGMLASGALYARAGGSGVFAAGSIVAASACALSLVWGRRLRSAHASAHVTAPAASIPDFLEDGTTARVETAP